MHAGSSPVLSGPPSLGRPPPRIVIVDDDPEILTLVAGYLKAQRFDTWTRESGYRLDELIRSAQPDLVVLDRVLPGEDGLSICRRLAAKRIPVIMLSAKGSPGDRIDGLDIGADDYVAKPFDPAELLARIRAVLRRRELQPVDPYADDTGYRFRGWTLATRAGLLHSPQGRAVPLTPSERALLAVFLDQPRKILGRAYLQTRVSRPGEAYERMVDLHVSRLRRKLDDGPGDSVIQTLRGEGYMFMPAVSRV